MNKIKKISILILTFVLFLSAGICIIVNYAVDSKITWAYYPLISIIFAWMILSAFIIPKSRKLTVILAAVALTIFPYLWFIESLTGGSWFYSLAVPITAFSLICVAVIIFLTDFTKFNKLNIARLALIILLVLEMGVNYIADSSLNKPIDTLSLIINIFVVISGEFILYIIGEIRKSNRLRAEN